jgi:hypothetical protein
MKTVALKYMPGDECYVRGEDRTCYIESIHITEQGIMYCWCNYDYGVDCAEVWADGYFEKDDIGVTVFDSMAELEKAFPNDFGYGYDEYE